MEIIADSDTSSEGDETGHEVLANVADDAQTPRSPKRASPIRQTALFGLTAVLASAAMTGWLAYRAHESRQAQVLRSQLLQVARQGALNLTTIDWQHADADVHRILDGATGEFYDDFSKRAQPFIEVVKQAKSTTVGTIAESGLESQTPNSAQVLVAVSVRSSDAGAPDPGTRAWRMRITVQKVGDQVKVSNVGFVS